MTFSRVLYRWHRWLLEPISPVNVSLLRIIFGLLFLFNLVLLWPDRYMWFADGGVWSKAQAVRDLGSDRLDLFRWLVSKPFEVDIAFSAMFLIGILVTVGLWTRVSLILAWLVLVSMSHRVSVMIHSGDTLMRLIAFFLIFSPCHAWMSLDSQMKATDLAEKTYRPVAQRILQYQLCLIYFITAYWKLKGSAWHDGSAVALVMNLTEFQRFPLPDFFRGLAFSKFATGFTAVVEVMFPILVWFKDTRTIALLAGISLHAGLHYCLNVQLFATDHHESLCAFLRPETILKVASYLQTRLRKIGN